MLAIRYQMDYSFLDDKRDEWYAFYNTKMKKNYDSDKELGTGTDLCADDERWYVCTLGKKKRTNAAYLDLYTTTKHELQDRIKKCTQSRGTSYETSYEENYSKDLATIEQMLTWIEKLDNMLNEELFSNWKWETGLRSQVQLRKDIVAAGEKISWDTRKFVLQYMDVLGLSVH